MSRKRKSASPADTHEDVDVADPSTAEGVDSASPADEDELDTREGMLAAMEEAAGGSEEDDTLGADDDAGQDADAGDAGKDDPEGGKKPEGDDKTAASKPDADDKGAAKEDDGEDLSPGQRVPYDRFKTQVDLRKQYAEERDSAIQERDQYRQGHDRFSAIDQFRERSGLSHEDVATAIKLAGAINQDPAAALEQLRPIYERLNAVVGNTLPEDIQARVDTGEISETDARELVRTRNENARLAQQNQQRQQQDQQAQQQQALRTHRQKLVDAATQEEKALAERDPDFKMKLPFIKQRLQLLVQEKRPDSPEAARELVREAYDATTAELAGFARKAPVGRRPRSDEGGKGNGSAEPDNMLDAMLQAADGS